MCATADARTDVPQGFGRTRVLVEHVHWTPKAYARHLLKHRGQLWTWGCLNALWTRESGWDPAAVNPSSGAGGIPQALPPSKMGRNWRRFKVQVRWGVNVYIPGRYGHACAAWAHSQATGWY